MNLQTKVQIAAKPNKTMSEFSEDPSPEPIDTPDPEITLESVYSKISEVLEMNDLLHSEMAEIKNTLKAIVEVAKAVRDDSTEKKPLDDDHNSMYG